MKEVRLALLGFGRVGQSIARLLSTNDGYRREGVRLEIHSVFDRGGGLALGGTDPAKLADTKRRRGSVASHPEGRAILLEEALESLGQGGILIDGSVTDATTGGPGLAPARRALDLGLSVVFASKGPLVAAQAALARAAREKGARIGASAAVGIPLPSLEVGLLGLRGASVTRVRGLLNDTANQILRGLESGSSLEKAVEAARAAGTIEEDPRLDLEGWDAAYKLLILCRALWDESLTLEAAVTLGVGAFGRAELDEARSRGRRVRLIATGERPGEEVRLRTEPEALGPDDRFYALGPGEKAVSFETELMGGITLSSTRGGPMATAASVLKDVLNIASPPRPFA
jgi:homoserine dehydrogenase